MALPDQRNAFTEPNVSPGEEAGMRSAWQGRSRADTETAQASKSNRPQTDIQPTPSLPVQPGQEKKETQKPAGDESEETEAEPKESRLARALRQKQAARRRERAKEYEAVGAAGAGKGTMQKYRQVKNLIRVIRGGSLAGTSLGDIFFSLSVLFLSLVGEWLLSKFIPGYQLFPKDDPFVILDKILWYVGWAVVISAVIFIITIVVIINYMKENPIEALKLFPALKNVGL